MNRYLVNYVDDSGAYRLTTIDSPQPEDPESAASRLQSMGISVRNVVSVTLMHTEATSSGAHDLRLEELQPALQESGTFQNTGAITGAGPLPTSGQRESVTVNFPASPNFLAPTVPWSLGKALALCLAGLVVQWIVGEFLDYPALIFNFVAMFVVAVTVSRVQRQTAMRLAAFYGVSAFAFIVGQYPIWMGVSAILGYTNLTPYPLNLWTMVMFTGNCSAAILLVAYFNPNTRAALSRFIHPQPPRIDPIRLGVAVVVGLLALRLPMSIEGPWEVRIHPTASQKAQQQADLASSTPNSLQRANAQLRQEIHERRGKYLPATRDNLAGLVREESDQQIWMDSLEINEYATMPDVPTTNIIGEPTDMTASHWYRVSWCVPGSGYVIWQANPYEGAAYQKGVTTGGC